MARVPCCPICYSLIREPVVFPCNHEVCRECFDHSLKTANFCCPLCRKRVSSWARRHAKDPVDHRRKRELEERLQKLQEDTTLYPASGERADFLRALPYSYNLSVYVPRQGDFLVLPQECNLTMCGCFVPCMCRCLLSINAL